MILQIVDLPLAVYSSGWQSVLVSAEPMMWMVLGSDPPDPFPSPLLRRIDDEMVDTGWIVKSTYLLIPGIWRGRPRRVSADPIAQS